MTPRHCSTIDKCGSPRRNASQQSKAAALESDAPLQKCRHTYLLISTVATFSSPSLVGATNEDVALPPVAKSTSLATNSDLPEPVSPETATRHGFGPKLTETSPPVSPSTTPARLNDFIDSMKLEPERAFFSSEATKPAELLDSVDNNRGTRSTRYFDCIPPCRGLCTKRNACDLTRMNRIGAIFIAVVCQLSQMFRLWFWKIRLDVMMVCHEHHYGFWF